MTHKVYELVVACLQPLFDELNIEQTISPETKIYSKGAALNSLLFIRLLVEIEEEIYSTFGERIIITDEKALSMNHSPFRTVQSLSEYISNLLPPND